MGDRTWAEVYFRRDYLGLVFDYEEKNGDKYDSVKEFLGNDDGESPLVQVSNYEANYGNMEFCTDRLNALRIPYDRNWGQGDEYGEGSEYVRWDEEGKGHSVEVYDSSLGVIPGTPLKNLLKEKGTTIEDVLNHIQEVEESQEPPLGQYDLEDIPIRELTEEEAALIMAYKLKGDK